MSETRIIAHPDGYVGLEVGRTIVVLSALGDRIPLMSTDERRWLIDALREMDDEKIVTSASHLPETSRVYGL